MARLSWQNWDPATWQDVWIYRRHFSVPHEFEGVRLFLEFDGVTVSATPFVNCHALPEHLGGYLGEVLALSRSFSSDPFSDRLWLRADDARLLADGSDSTRVVFRVVTNLAPNALLPPAK